MEAHHSWVEVCGHSVDEIGLLHFQLYFYFQLSHKLNLDSLQPTRRERDLDCYRRQHRSGGHWSSCPGKRSFEQGIQYHHSEEQSILLPREYELQCSAAGFDRMAGSRSRSPAAAGRKRPSRRYFTWETVVGVQVREAPFMQDA